MRVVLVISGIVAVGAGAYAVLTGVSGMPGDPAVDPSVDSELRFFATFYIAFGAATLWLARRIETQPHLVRFWALALFGAGLARAVGWLDAGRPPDLFVGLMFAELVLPALVLLWQRRL